MKLIEALKKKKDVLKKAEDYRNNIRKNSALMDFETPPYGDKQREKVKEFLQGHFDLMKEYASLAIKIQRTNLKTMVTIELGGEKVTRSVAEWVIRRRELSTLDFEAWSGLSDRGLKDSREKQSNGEFIDKKVVRFYDQSERDNKVELYRSEAHIIDGQLEVINAVTDLVESE